ncbi:DUF4240 domain-containing protein [Curtobacterium sp. RRHDQ10]|uniref:DUF4240 domain-containing protein n=1 Tax=Curtobacterium phyllosphaerae TaxID=3413379 RepID=UPI003BF250BD
MPRVRTPIVVATAVVLAVALSGCTQPVRLLNKLPEQTHVAQCRSNVPGHAGAVPSAAPTSRSDRITAREVTEAEAVAMPEDQFWALIDTLHGSESDAAFHRLRAALEARPVADLVPFEARLDLALYALDDECRVDWYDHHDPSGLGELADDDFLYVRTDTVAAGRAVWEDANTHDTLPWGTVDAVDDDGEELLYVAAEAAHHSGISGDDFAKRVPFDDVYETASNPAGWSDTGD